MKHIELEGRGKLCSTLLSGRQVDRYRLENDPYTPIGEPCGGCRFPSFYECTQQENGRSGCVRRGVSVVGFPGVLCEFVLYRMT